MSFFNQLIPMLKTVVDNLLDSRFARTHTTAIGYVLGNSYDRTNLTATIQPVIQKLPPNATTPIDAAPIGNVPVFFPGQYVFDLLPNQSGLLIFLEHNINYYYTTGNKGLPLNNRRFDINDCIFMPGQLVMPSLVGLPTQQIREHSSGDIRVTSPGTLDLSATTVNLGGSQMYVVLSPTPGPVADVSQLTASTTIKGQ